MNIYLVERQDEVDYDEYRAMVFVASTPERAREMASERNGFEKPEIWLDEQTTCTLIGTASGGGERLVLASFNAG